MKVLTSVVVLALGLFSPDPAVPMQGHCEVFGTVYVEKDRSRADYLVYQDKNEAFADLLVFKETSRLYADREGIWYFTSNRGMADFTVYYVKEKGQANFSIFFTDTESFAGCN